MLGVKNDQYLIVKKREEDLPGTPGAQIHTLPLPQLYLWCACAIKLIWIYSGGFFRVLANPAYICSPAFAKALAGKPITGWCGSSVGRAKD